ncbi:class I SAM-dependent methyltransferase [Mesoterricola silvestris]|uniref:Methyltransferase type 11 domain-containing protein n=1 Tax=Mesoterricola silvestris TaxID=2927979 RepID=A0AA48K8G9_9BACT|nr:class I SAM-dependent methyltransferase [Mesoterricola silvestris]BDU72276.1 hypothetical protein METEAL_14500 [Mesoterricola silvestris]
MDRKPESITHLHLLAIILTELGRFEGAPVIRILDLGCGNGHLMAYLQDLLPARFPGRTFEVWGHDVEEYEGHARDMLDTTLAYLRGEHPGVPWERFARIISAADRWPYPDDFFHVILTNQVMEHVEDPDLVFREISRVLCEGGFSAHLFPFSCAIQEGHLRLPWVHRIRNHEYRAAYIRFMSRLGFGLYRQRRSRYTLDAFTETYSDFIRLCTHYMPKKMAFSLADRHHLRISFPYTQDYYTQKLRSLLGLAPRYRYRLERRVFRDWLAFGTLKFVNCITMFLEKRDAYSLPDPGKAGG